MVYIPDLFGAFMKGREYAIDRNWQDLKNYEAVESARNANDLQALQIRRERARFGGEMSIFQNNVDQSGRANEVAEAAQSGKLALADLGSMAAQDQRSAFINNRLGYQQALNDLFAARVGQQANNAAYMNAENAYLAADGRAGQLGTMAGQNAFSQGTANNITAAYAPTQAANDVASAQANFATTQAGHRLALANTNAGLANVPNMAALTAQTTQNQLFDARNVQSQREANAAASRQNIINDIQNQIYQLNVEYEKTGSPAALTRIQQLVAQLYQVAPELAPKQEAPAAAGVGVLNRNVLEQNGLVQPLITTPGQSALQRVNEATAAAQAVQNAQNTQPPATAGGSLIPAAPQYNDSVNAGYANLLFGNY